MLAGWMAGRRLWCGWLGAVLSGWLARGGRAGRLAESLAGWLPGWQGGVLVAGCGAGWLGGVRAGWLAGLLAG